MTAGAQKEWDYCNHILQEEDITLIVTRKGYQVQACGTKSDCVPTLNEAVFQVLEMKTFKENIQPLIQKWKDWFLSCSFHRDEKGPYLFIEESTVIAGCRMQEEVEKHPLFQFDGEKLKSFTLIEYVIRPQSRQQTLDKSNKQ